MKRVALLLSAALVCSVAALGQGQFVFNNHVPPDINARFIFPCSDGFSGETSSVGPDWNVLLYNSANFTLTPLDPPGTTFRGAAGTAFAGYVLPTTETVPGVPPGANANIVVRLVSSPSIGADANFGPYPVRLGGGTIPPPNLPLGTTPLEINLIGPCPEPSTIFLALVGLGAAALWLRLRRRGKPCRACYAR